MLIDGLLQPLASCQKLLEGETEKEPSRNFRRCCSLPKSIFAHLNLRPSALTSVLAQAELLQDALTQHSPGAAVLHPARKKWDSPNLKLHLTDGQAGSCTHTLCSATKGQITATQGRKKGLKIWTHVLLTG